MILVGRKVPSKEAQTVSGVGVVIRSQPDFRTIDQLWGRDAGGRFDPNIGGCRGKVDIERLRIGYLVRRYNIRRLWRCCRSRLDLWELFCGSA
jgi:hypothetical protein